MRTTTVAAIVPEPPCSDLPGDVEPIDIEVPFADLPAIATEPTEADHGRVRRRGPPTRTGHRL